MGKPPPPDNSTDHTLHGDGSDAAPPSHLITSDTRAMVFFGMTVLWLTLLGFSLPHGGVSDTFSDILWGPSSWLLPTLILIWAIIVADALIGVFQAPDKFAAPLKRCALICLLPPARLAISSAIPNRYLWLPRQGWLAVGSEHQDQLERRLLLPMLAVTLLILPVIGAELFFKEQVATSPLIALLIHTTTSFIWVAFTCEFILMVAIAEKKIAYCKQHWINIVIILLPLVAFLRTLQLFRFLRLTKAGKLLRAYRLRGVFARALRLALMMNLIERLMQRNINGYIGHLEEKINEKQHEIDELKQKLVGAQQKRASKEPR